MGYRRIAATGQDAKRVFPYQKNTLRLLLGCVFVLACAIGAWFFRRDPGLNHSRASLLAMCAVVLFACAAYVAFTAVRIADFDLYHLELGPTHATLPLYPLAQCRVKDIAYTDIDALEHAVDRNGRRWVFVVTREGRYRLPVLLLGTKEKEAVFRLAFRAALARSSHPIAAESALAAEEDAVKHGPAVAMLVAPLGKSYTVLGITEDANATVELLRDDNQHGVSLPPDFLIIAEPTLALAPVPSSKASTILTA